MIESRNCCQAIGKWSVVLQSLGIGNLLFIVSFFVLLLKFRIIHKWKIACKCIMLSKNLQGVLEIDAWWDVIFFFRTTQKSFFKKNLLLVIIFYALNELYIKKNNYPPPHLYSKHLNTRHQVNVEVLIQLRSEIISNINVGRNYYVSLLLKGWG